MQRAIAAPALTTLLPERRNMADNLHIGRTRAPQTPAAPFGATVIAFPPRPACPVAPPFDRNNPAHVVAWEALFQFGLAQLRGR